jgi:hypothetical protein
MKHKVKDSDALITRSYGEKAWIFSGPMFGYQRLRIEKEHQGKVDKLIKDRRNHLNSELSAIVKIKLTKRVNTLQQMRLEQRIKELDWIKENL